MATPQSLPPPLGKMSMIGIWVETVLYGINCVVYTLCMITLLRGGRALSLRWVLITVSTILFLLCTGHVAASLQQLLDAFIYAPAGVAEYSSSLYWLDFCLTPSVVKDVLYGIMGLFQHTIQIWRLYVVFLYDWRVVIVPIILLAGYVGIALAAVAVTSIPQYTHDAALIIPLTISAPVLDVALTVLVTIAIVARLCWMNRKTDSLTGISTNRFASSIYIVIESGAILTAFSTVFLILFVLGHSIALIGLDILAQLTVLVPILIFLKVGRTGHHRPQKIDTCRIAPPALMDGEATSQAGILQEPVILRDVSFCDTFSTRTQTFAHDMPV